MKTLKATFAIALLAVIFSCSKDEDPQPENPKVTTVYAGGSEDDANGKHIPTIWKDGVAQQLPISAGSNGEVIALFSEGNDLYAVGHENSSSSPADYRAVMWKNGVKTTLSTISSSAKAIYVANGIPYIVGIEGNIATLWHKSNHIDYQYGMNGSIANGIFVKENDIYIAGSDEQGIATQWKNNGSLTALSFTPTHLESTASSAMAISVLDNNVYIAGRLTNNVTITANAKLWKNNVSTAQFSDNTQMWSVFAQGQNVYAVGASTVTPWKAMLWKNNQPTQLSQNESFAYSIFATATDNYVAGFEKNPSNKACIWKNGTIQILSTNNSAATSVFVTEK